FFLWTAIYGGQAEEEAVLFGYEYSQMVVYIVMAAVMARIVATGFEYDIMRDIMEGNMNRFFVQPVGHLPYRIIGFFGGKLIECLMAVIIGAGLLFMLVFTVGAEFDFMNIAVALAVAPLSLLINCMMFYFLSATSFWLTWGWGVFNGWGVVTTILSGGIFPISVFGETAVAILRFLPFQYIIYFPLNIVVGNASRADIIEGVSMQLTWILIFWALSQLYWRVGMKKYIAARG
ncbi:MAG: ABC-2 family transporter protein, partial [Oscillospiraceae bacterium]|nr:ABC-2 family transporter protein [Oscillospiraceae bacterium]